MTPTDAPPGFEAFQANPFKPCCHGCHYETSQDECPVNEQGNIWCEAHNRTDKTQAIFQAIKE